LYQAGQVKGYIITGFYVNVLGGCLLGFGIIKERGADRAVRLLANVAICRTGSGFPIGPGGEHRHILRLVHRRGIEDKTCGSDLGVCFWKDEFQVEPLLCRGKIPLARIVALVACVERIDARINTLVVFILASSENRYAVYLACC
jgi:hypothetical protein